MTPVLIAILTMHAAIHLLGFAKGFGMEELAPITRPIRRSVGVVWLCAALAFYTGAAMLVVVPHYGWIPIALALVLSQALIVHSWRDAKLGTVTNLAVAASLVFIA